MLFFVKKELVEKYLDNLLKSLPSFEVSKMRESRAENGVLSCLRGDERLKEISNLELMDLQSNEMIKIGNLI